MTLEEFAKNPDNCVFASALITFKQEYNTFDYGFLSGWLLALSSAGKLIQSDFDSLYNELDTIWGDDV